ncbi:MAG: histidine kinase [Rhodococcus sp. (in: high G+C Gram-positive bacteria)]|uniref:GAF domain-containing sensor histidine kinase n=1 Tax=Rhodococcus sp. TaxID=1831 RepID=UPI002AD97CAC|nr:histidine kinase [Rhodococcus sp. (in: high G+C Gram-positive bacteria)]
MLTARVRHAEPVDALRPDSDLVVTVADGNSPEEIVGLLIPVVGSAIGTSFRTRTSTRGEHLEFDVNRGSRVRYGPALVSPLRTPDSVSGVLVALREHDTEPFSENQLAFLTTFADQAAVALQLAHAARKLRELDALKDRDRIARDLHDSVIQRIFAAGLSLQVTAQQQTSVVTKARLAATIDDLQDVVQDVRNAIFDLQGGTLSESALRARIHDAVDEISADSSVRTTIRVHGPLSVIDQSLADHAVAVIREGVSNAVRHAYAQTVQIALSIADDIRIDISDDGIGIADSVASSGLDNLRSRALECGGSLTVGKAHRRYFVGVDCSSTVTTTAKTTLTQNRPRTDTANCAWVASARVQLVVRLCGHVPLCVRGRRRVGVFRGGC